jgi:type I restriction enzyme S subunit
MPVFKALTEAIQTNEFECEQLAELRDSLLPKLMSGEIDVSALDI